MRSRRLKPLYSRRLKAERVQILISTTYGGFEEWVDLEDHLDGVLVMPVEPHLTLAEYKRRMCPNFYEPKVSPSEQLGESEQ